MKNAILISFILILISFGISFSRDVSWYPNANDFVYNGDEDSFVIDVFSRAEGIGSKNVIESIIDFKYDLAKYKDRIFTGKLIYKLISAVENNNINIKSVVAEKFVSENENSNSYDADSIYKKILAWILLRPGITEIGTLNDDELFNILRRRQHLLKKIIDNNKDYAPLAYYILIVIDGINIGTDPTPELAKRKIEAFQTLIDMYPKSEYAFSAKFGIAMICFSINEEAKAVNIYEDILKNYSNFYSARGDLYSDAYMQLLYMYEYTGKKDKIKPILEKINKKVKNYTLIMKHYNDILK